MKIEYYLADPAGNITALVICPPVPDLKMTARKIMEENRSVEQVGFADFSGDDIKLRMSGDEFCGNATMSVAALKHLISGKSGELNTAVSVFGTPEPIKVNVNLKDGYYNCRCAVGKPEKTDNIRFTAGDKEYDFPIVSFSGITHIVADDTLGEQAAAEVIRGLADRLSVKALGIMMLSSDKKHLKPLVYVKSTDTLFFENSCASGSCAVAAVVCPAGEKTELIQPGGIIGVKNSDGFLLYGQIKIGECRKIEV